MVAARGRTARGGPLSSFARLALRASVVLLALELVYLVVANALIRSSIIKDAVSGADGFTLEYSRGYSLWPGHVRARDVALRVEDYNVQFEVAIADADLDIALRELPFKKFRVTRLDASGTRFRMRHKLITVGDDAERIAAYPPIRGFADPPYYVGVRSPPIADEEYDLWSVQIQNVSAQVRELWVMEYRFSGSGHARGSFVVKPARWVQVEPAELVLERGTLTLGAHRVAETMKGKITCDIPDMRVQESEGVEVLQDISTTVKLELSDGQPSFLRAYLARVLEADYAGKLDILVDVNLQRGIVERGSRVSARFSPLRVTQGELSLDADVMLNAGRDVPSAPDELVLAWSSPRLLASRVGKHQKSPELLGVTGSLGLTGVDLKRPLELGELRFAIADARAPELAWFNRGDIALAGAASGSLSFLRERDGAVGGEAQLEATGLRLRGGDLAVDADVVTGKMSFRGPPGTEKGVEMRQLSLDLRHARLQSGDKRTEPFALTLDGGGLRVAPPRASGVVAVQVSSAEALLPLFMSAPIKDVTGAALALEHLRVRARVDIDGGDWDLRLLDAESGNLQVRGYLRKRSTPPLGAFLVSSGPIHVGVTLSDGETDVSPFVSDAWLVTAWPRLVAKQPAAG